LTWFTNEVVRECRTDSPLLESWVVQRFLSVDKLYTPELFGKAYLHKSMFVFKKSHLAQYMLFE